MPRLPKLSFASCLLPLFKPATGNPQPATGWTQTSGKGKMTVTVQPAGNSESFFLTMSALEHEPDQQEVANIFSENGMQVVGPPLKIN